MPNHHARDDLLKRVRPDRPHSAELRKAVEQCFDFVAAVEGERRNLSFDPSLNAPKRRDALGQFVSGQLFQPLANALHPIQKLKAHVQDERSKLKPWQSGLSGDIAALAEDVAAVDAALYFAKRELENAAAVSPHDLDALLSPPAWR